MRRSTGTRSRRRRPVRTAARKLEDREVLPPAMEEGGGDRLQFLPLSGFETRSSAYANNKDGSCDPS
jgi:hypothetical protein